MGICKYCGQDAGFFGDKHPACEYKNNLDIQLKNYDKMLDNIIKEEYKPPKEPPSPKKIEVKKTIDDKWITMLMEKYIDPPQTSMNVKELLKRIQDDFTASEKDRLDEVYQESRKVYTVGNIFDNDFGNINGEYSIKGESTLEMQLSKHNRPFDYFSDFIKYLDHVKDFDICDKIFKIIDDNSKLFADSEFLHFYYLNKIRFYYRNRELVDGAFDKAIESCINMIKIAKQLSNLNNKRRIQDNPSHLGYEQLAIILQKYGKYEEVISLCQQAKDEGWNGDWDKRIEAAKKKLEKTKK